MGKTTRVSSPDGRFEIHPSVRESGGFRWSEEKLSWKVVDTTTGKTIASFKGTYNQHTDSDGEIERYGEGVWNVKFSADSRSLVVRHADETEKTIDLLQLAEPSGLGRALGESL